MKGFVIGACYENVMGDSDLHGNLKVRDRIAQAVTAYWNCLRNDPDAQFGTSDSSNEDHPSPCESESDASLESAAE